MKRPFRNLVGFVLVLAMGAWTISLLSARPGLSMRLVEYRRWPHGAMVRLTNGTHATIRYLAERNDTPAGSPILSVEKTSDGWTSASVTLKSTTIYFGATSGTRNTKTTEVYFLTNPAALPQPGARFESLYARDLTPGQSVEFFVRLEPGASPKRVGTICLVPQSKIARKLQPWLLRFKQWCRLKSTLPGQVEVWCPDRLHLSPSQ